MGLNIDFSNFNMGNIDATNVEQCDVANFGFNTHIINFNDFDLGGLDDITIDINFSANLNFEDTLQVSKEARLLLGPHNTFKANLNSMNTYHPRDLPMKKLKHSPLLSHLTWAPQCFKNQFFPRRCGLKNEKSVTTSDYSSLVNSHFDLFISY